MAFTKLNGFTSLISNLPDVPGGTMTSLELKQYFDNSPEEVRVALNNLIEELQTSTAAGSIGADTVAGLSGATIQTLIESLKNYIDTHKNSKNNPHGVTAAQLNVYTKNELAPYLQGGDTLIRYEVFTIVSSNNGDGTFSYKDKNNTMYTGALTAEGYQVFSFKKGVYDMGLNRVECLVGDTLHRSVESGGLQEVSNTKVALTIPEGNGAEITFKYFERIGITGEHNLVVGNVQPPTSGGNTVWFKVV
jgi:hypothetical protein